MKITDVRVKLVSSESRLRGVATITFDESFVVHDIRIIEGENGKLAHSEILLTQFMAKCVNLLKMQL